MSDTQIIALCALVALVTSVVSGIAGAALTAGAGYATRRRGKSCRAAVIVMRPAPADPAWPINDTAAEHRARQRHPAGSDLPYESCELTDAELIAWAEMTRQLDDDEPGTTGGLLVDEDGRWWPWLDGDR